MQSRILRRTLAVAAAAGLVLGTMSATSYAATGNGNPMKVFVMNTADDPLPVAGRVDVGNLPSTQTVNGTVDVGNLPATQQVSGTVGIDPTANTVQVDLSEAEITAVAPPTAVLKDSGFHIFYCTYSDFGCSTTPITPVPSATFDIDTSGASQVRVLVEVQDASANSSSSANPCEVEDCVDVSFASVSPSGESFPVHPVRKLKKGGSTTLVLDVPGTVLRVTTTVRSPNDHGAYAMGKIFVVGRS